MPDSSDHARKAAEEICKRTSLCSGESCWAEECPHEQCADNMHKIAAIIERHVGEKSDGAGMIARERQRQKAEEGWTAEHDDKHTRRELALAACAYALPGPYNFNGEVITPQRIYDLTWWDQKWFKRSDKNDMRPENMIPNLVKAGALIAAEIDRLKRKEAAP